MKTKTAFLVLWLTLIPPHEASIRAQEPGSASPESVVPLPGIEDATAAAGAGVAKPELAEASSAASWYPAGEGLRLNFRDVPLEQVLDYLSQAAGFIIIREAEVNGTVDVVSHQPLDDQEAVDLLNAILNRKGYTAIRSGRMLTIVKREEALGKDLPVRTGNRPEMIPPTDEMVTQIIPVQSINAQSLVDNLRPLIPAYADLSANESSNAIVLTDTQRNVRRIVEIIRALDSSGAGNSVIKVFPLEYGVAEEVAGMINELFQPEESRSQESRRGRMEFFFERMRGESERSRESQTGSGAAGPTPRVLAVADQQTNSLVVSAPAELMPTIEAVIAEIDQVSVTVKELRVFHLRYANAAETAELITNLFQPATRSTSRRSSDRPPWMRFERGPESERSSSSALREYEVVARADERTNSVVVVAQREILDQIDQMVRELDSDPAKKQKVFVYELKNADAASIADVLRGMFGEETTQTQASESTRSRPTLGSTTTREGSGSEASTRRSSR